jgi:hypothetical protein
MDLAMEAGEEMATRVLVRGGPAMDAVKQDVEKFRGKAAMAALQAADDLGLKFRIPPPSTDVLPAAAPPADQTVMPPSLRAPPPPPPQGLRHSRPRLADQLRPGK